MSAAVVSRSVAYLISVLLVASLWPAASQAQATGRVRVAQENFRKEPNGTQLATVLQGTEFPVLAERGSWAQVQLQGWIWAPSVAQTSREGFELTVNVAGGENLRASPSGQAAIKARLLQGCLLERVDASGNWVQVQRSGWLWRASLDISGSVPAAGAGEQETDLQSLLTARSPLAVYATPDGDTIATFEPGAQAQVLGRTGDWIRIRVDGWVYGPAALDSAVDLADTGGITPAQLRADPGRYRGALVRWRVQFISLRRAERSRADFQEGEPFIHARGPAGDAGFVYLAVPEELLSIAETLEPLEYVTVVGRVRTGRSSLLGSPVIDLTDIERGDTRR